VLTNLIPKLLHESDGLIFQDWEDSYEPLTCPDLLKWKYSHLNSVDFKLEAKPKAGAASGGGGEKNSDDYDYSLSVQRGGRPMPLEDAQITFPNHINPLDFVNTIIECTYNADFKTWVFLRDRVDKETANDFNVYRKVVKSIEDNIGEEEIIAFTQKASQEPMYEKDRNRPAGV
jgi:mRNA-capping enzyme